jgi:L-amino acid N-acyltransferase YncA
MINGQGGGRRIGCPQGDFFIRLMVEDDEAAVLSFSQSLPKHDLLFLPRDISKPKVLSAWIKEIGKGGITSFLAVRDDNVLGCATIACDPLSWSPHVGEVRVVIASAARGQGVGRALTQEAFAFARSQGLEKMTAQMTVDQVGGIALFESLGFKAEALLRDHVKDSDGRKYDIVVLGHDVAQVAAKLEAYGAMEGS